MPKKNQYSFLFQLFSFFILSAVFVGSTAAEARVLPDTPESAEANAGKFADWRTVGPNGGDVRAIVVDPANSNHFYFGTLDGQIYTSYDAGQSWRMLYNLNRPGLVLDNMVIDIRDPKTMYVAGHKAHVKSEAGGFYKSTDGGASWREVKGLRTTPIFAMIQSSKNPDMLAVGAGDGVHVSFDSGNTWEKLPNENVPGLINVNSIAIDPRNTDVIYAGTFYRPYKTTDGGKTWRLISKGMIDDSDVFAINIDPRNPDHIFASACSGIYESYDAGENWKKAQGIPSQARRTRDILQHPSKAGYVYAATTEGFWMSADGGKSWSVTTTRQLEINSIAVHPEEPSKVYIGTNSYGVMVSEDFGKSFRQTNGGYSTRRTNLIVPDVEQPNRMYASTINTAVGGGFFYVSEDGGATWRASMKNYPVQLEVYSILQDETTPATIYLGTNKGVYRSLDRGASWAAVTAPKKAAAPRRRAPARKSAVKKPAVEVEKTEPEKPAAKLTSITSKINALVRTGDGKNGLLAATDKGLYRTYDIAKGWDLVPFAEGMDWQILALAATDNDTIWVGTARQGVLVSRDGGATWQRDSGIPERHPISDIEVDPLNSAKVYVGTQQTFYLTRNNGESWERRGGNLPAGDYNSIVINPNNTNEIFAASAQENRDGLFRSLDGGKTWERVDTDKLNLPSRRIWTLSFDSRNPNIILVGSHSAGIYRVERSLTTATN
jgi:photosystem II stability/assembly factor-like uncharacterized protein